MGAGIAAAAAMAGHRVKVADVSAELASNGVERAHEQVRRAQQHGRLDPSAAAAAGEQLHPASSLVELADAELVIEAVTEELTVKQELMVRLDRLLHPAALIATNTSSLPIAEVTAPMSRPERSLGLHFFNPAPVMPLVEVVGSPHTQAETLTRALELMQAWGKTPVVCADSPGFVVNRVARPLYGEAHRLVDERAVDPATLDMLIRTGAGLPMGPVALGDLVGQDVNFAVTRSIWEQTFHDPRYAPSLVQQDWVRRGLLGRKVGRSILDGQRARTEPARPAPMSIGDAGGLDVLQPLVERARRAGVTVRGSSDSADYPGGGLVLPSGGLLMVTDGETATSHALQDPVVIMDWLVEPVSAERIGLAASEGCPQEVADDAIGFLQAAGVQVSLIDDVPGLVVARTLSMIINEAYDVVTRGVATATDVNLAMRLGAGYPWGPFDLVRRFGASRVVAVLDALHAWYPTGRYRVTPALRRAALAEEAGALPRWAG